MITDKKLGKYFSIGLAILSCSLAAGAQVLRGTATNGTTKKPAAGDDVVLLRLDTGMQEEMKAKTNARGEFNFNLPDNQAMRAVRVRHQGVNYFQPVQPGTASVTVTVYEAAPAVQGLHQNNRSIIFEAQGNILQVFEVFTLQNDSRPPRTQPAFSFYVPDGATMESGQAARQGGMALKVAPFSQGDNRYTVAYPLLPGQTHIEINYKLAYTGAFNFQPRLEGEVKSLYIVTPKSMGFSPASATLYQTADPQSLAPDLVGMDLHIASSTSDDKQLAFSIAGEGLIPQQTAQQTGGQQGNAGNEDNHPGGGMGIPNERPNPLSGGQWAFLGVLTLFLAAGGVFIFFTARNGTVVASASGARSQSTALMDALKEEMFQLESDRLQGKINGHEYDAAKAALVKTLQRTMGKKS